MLKAGKETIKYINKQNILNSFFGASEVSKAEVISATNLSAATVSALIQELVDESILVELGYGESSGGRRPMLYKLNTELYYVLTIRITTKGVLLAVVDLAGQIVYHNFLLSRIHSGESMKEAITAIIENLRGKEPSLYEKISSVAYSVPGVIDYFTKTVVYSAALYLEDVNLEQITHELLAGEPEVYVFKDTDALVLGEYFCSNQRDNNMAYILCDSGVGMSIINRGKLLRIDNCGLELGHTVIDVHGTRCKCSARGCVGTMIGELPAIHQYAQLYEQHKNGTLLDITTISYDDLVTLYLENHDALAGKVISEQIEILSVIITNVVNLFNPDVVIIGGPLARLSAIDKELAETVKHRVLKPFAQNLAVQASKQGTDASLFGMARYVLQKEFFKPVSI